MKKIHLIASSMFVFLMGIALLLPVSALAASTTSSSPTASSVTNRFTGIPVTGTNSNGDTFTGRLNVTSFANDGGKLMANGTLNGTVKDASGKVVGKVNNQAVTVPTTIPQGTSTTTQAIPQAATCTILNLVLGPIHLDLLGLVIDTNQITINITANPAGGLLGQLLCDIANLLNSPGGLLGNLNAIVTDLNKIIATLGV